MAVATMGGRVGEGGMGEGMAGVSGWPDLDSSVDFLIQPIFGTHCSSPNWEVSFSLPLFFLSVPLDLIPSVWLAWSRGPLSIPISLTTSPD